MICAVLCAINPVCAQTICNYQRFRVVVSADVHSPDRRVRVFVQQICNLAACELIRRLCQSSVRNACTGYPALKVIAVFGRYLRISNQTADISGAANSSHAEAADKRTWRSCVILIRTAYAADVASAAEVGIHNADMGDFGNVKPSGIISHKAKQTDIIHDGVVEIQSAYRVIITIKYSAIRV